MIELLAQWRLRRGVDEQEVMHCRNEDFQRSIPDSAFQKPDVVIGVDTASWILAERCREIGQSFVLDQSTVHPDAKQAMHHTVRTRFPEWSSTGFEMRLPMVRQAEIREQHNATLIVCGSSFSKQTLIDHAVPAEKIRIIPYGVDSERFKRSVHQPPRPFRFVFVGIVTARKGVPILIEAWKQLSPKNAELWFVGATSSDARRLIPELAGLRLLGPVPQMDVPTFLQQCDVFVFPSFFEGFGLVILEAMACGLPVITTTATAGPDIISHDQDGWIIEPGDLDGLVRTMRSCLENRNRVAEMGRKARATAEKFSWDTYGDRWVTILQDVMTCKS
jgi:starch synthase